jgi:hypothetical protein
MSISACGMALDRLRAISWSYDWTIRKGFSGGRLGTGHTERKDICRNKNGQSICDSKGRLDNIDGFAPG